ncbi:MAG: NAD-dependent epimerase/dehydratase family protein [Rhodocyclaceae bacterium]
MTSPRILVTGAGGFIGARLLAALVADGRDAAGLYRTPVAAGDQPMLLGDLADEAALERACAGFDAVVHCAGYAHAFGDAPGDAERLHSEINLNGTRRLVAAATRAGVRHLVFLSSVKAMGHPGAAVADETWPLPPDTAYGRAKRAAEAVVLDAPRTGGPAGTCLRLAMVYGRGGRGNLERMARGVRAGWFPPLPETGARRSLVHVRDVAAAIMRVLDDGRSHGRTFIVAHPVPNSGAELYDAIRAALGRPPARWRVPAGLLGVAGRLGGALSRALGRPLPIDEAVVARLLGAECYSARALHDALGWEARVGLAEGVAEMLGATAMERAA